MLKRISCLALSMVFFVGVLMQQVTAMEGLAVAEEQAAEAAETAEAAEAAVPEEQPEIPEGPQILLDGVIIEDAAPTIQEGTTYVSLRAVTLALRPDAVITWEGNHAAVTAEGLSMTVAPNARYIQANGRYLYLPSGVRLVDGCTMLPIRVLAKALDAQVTWDEETGNTHLTRGSGAIVSGDEFYNADSLYWLSHIIYAESGNQSLEGKIGVGNVILNRVNNPIFPNTIYEVIFQKNQFSPVRSGSINAEPNAESVIAAKLCLDGAVVLPSALWFNRAGISCWASRNKSCVATIGAHAFYA